MIQDLAKWVTRGFPLWSCLVALVALLYPNAFLWYGSDSIAWGLGLIMLGMGLTLKKEDFIRVLRTPLLVAFGVALQFAFMPAWGATLASVLQLPPEMAVGLILVACCPGGTASNVVVFLAGAELALSVCLTLCSTIVAVALTPWLTYLYAGRYLPIDAMALLESIAVMVVLPLVVGVFWNQCFPKSARKVGSFSPVVSVVFILLIVGYVLSSKRSLIFEHGWLLLLSTGLLHLGGFAGGYWGARFLGLDLGRRRTLSIEVGMQNSGLATALASHRFPDLPLAPAPCALSAILHCLMGGFLAARWSRPSLDSSGLPGREEIPPQS